MKVLSRDRYNEVVINEDNTRTINYSTIPKFHQKDDEWHVIDRNFVETDDCYINLENALKTYIKNNASESYNIIHQTDTGYEIKLDLQQIRYSNGLEVEKISDVMDSNNYIVEDYNGEYFVIQANAFPNVIDEYKCENGEVKHNIYLMNHMQETQLVNADLEIVYNVDLQPGTKIKCNDLIRVSDFIASNDIIFEFEEDAIELQLPIANDNNDISIGVMYKVNFLDENHLELIYVINNDLLCNNYIKYPICIDPTVSVDTGYNTYISSEHNFTVDHPQTISWLCYLDPHNDIYSDVNSYFRVLDGSGAQRVYKAATQGGDPISYSGSFIADSGAIGYFSMRAWITSTSSKAKASGSVTYESDFTAPTYSSSLIVTSALHNGVYWQKPNTTISVSIEGNDTQSGMQYGDTYLRAYDTTNSANEARIHGFYNGANYNNEWVISPDINLNAGGAPSTSVINWNSVKTTYYPQMLTPGKKFVLQGYLRDRADNAYGYFNLGKTIGCDGTAPALVSWSVTRHRYYDGTTYWGKPGDVLKFRHKGQDTESGPGRGYIKLKHTLDGDEEVASYHIDSGYAADSREDDLNRINVTAARLIATTTDTMEIEFDFTLNTKGNTFDLFWYWYDRCGNGRGYTDTGKNIGIDGDPPTIAANLSARDWDSSNISATITASDSESGVAATYYLWQLNTNYSPTSDNVGWVGFTNGATLTQSDSGIWYLHIKAVDGADNEKIVTYGPYKIDPGKPTVDIVSHTNDTNLGFINYNTLTFFGVYDDAVSGIQKVIGNSNGAYETGDFDIDTSMWEYSGDWLIDATSEGFDFTFSAIRIELQDKIKVYINQQDLEGHIDLYFNNNLVSAIAAGDNLEMWKVFDIPSSYINTSSNNVVRIQHNGGPADWGHIYEVKLNVWEWSYTFPDGYSKMHFGAYDNAGNYHKWNFVEFTVDTVGPANPDIYVTDVDETSLSLAWNANDSGSGINKVYLYVQKSDESLAYISDIDINGDGSTEYSLNVGAATSYTVEDLEPNEYYRYYVRVYDNAGNYTNDGYYLVKMKAKMKVFSGTGFESIKDVFVDNGSEWVKAKGFTWDGSHWVRIF